MTLVPRLPATFTVNGHVLRLQHDPLAGENDADRWTVTEQLGAITVGHTPLMVRGGVFTMVTSSARIEDADWAAALTRAFHRS